MISHDNKHNEDDKLVQDYDTILRESALLSIFSGFLFGFLLNVAILSHKNFEFIDKITLIAALYSVIVAISLFIMPVIYHHLQYPYASFNKFKSRSRKFIVFGLLPAGITLYLGLELAMHSLVGSLESFILASLPFILVYFLFRARKTNRL